MIEMLEFIALSIWAFLLIALGSLLYVVIVVILGYIFVGLIVIGLDVMRWIKNYER